MELWVYSFTDRGMVNVNLTIALQDGEGYYSSALKGYEIRGGDVLREVRSSTCDWEWRR